MNVLKPLIDDIAEGKCLPFVGAGFSRNARLSGGRKMPDWPGLTKILARQAGISHNLGGPKVAAAYERSFGRVQLIEAIRQALHSDHAEPGAAHVVFAQLSFDTIYTTNFDLLLEAANEQIRKPYRSLVGELQMPFHGGLLTANIVKMHGDLRHEEHIIVTQEDYDKYLDEYPVISTHLSAMLITRTALFIGYSLSDPDFGHIREVVRSRLGRFERMSYVVQFNQTESKIAEMLDDNLHVINLKIKKGQSKDECLAEFFRVIQEDLDVRQGKRLRASKPDIFEPVSEETLEAAMRAPDASALLASSSNMCFVLMPFGEPFDFIYMDLIKPVIIESGLDALRADEIFSPGSLMEQIRSAIQQSRACVADLTGSNSNVLYELGIAQTLGKPTILLSQDVSDLPFDVSHLRTILYDPKQLNRAKNKLAAAIQSVLGYDRLDEARQLINNGMIRASVATLGVLLEQTLRFLVLTKDLADVKMGEYSARSLTLGKMANILLNAGVISSDEATRLRGSIEIRNRAVHGLVEPTSEDALRLADDIETFIRAHMGGA